MTMDTRIDEYGVPDRLIHKNETANRKILVSLVKKINWIDPVAFYQAGNEDFVGKRFYWQGQSDDFKMVGLGITEKIKIEGAADRIQKVRDSWSKILKNMVRTGVNDQEGSGPVLFGGFSFDPNGKTTGLWKNFDSGLFYLPTFLLTVSRGQAYLTVNAFHFSGESLETLVSKMEEKADEILTKCQLVDYSTPKTEWLNIKKQGSEKWIELVNWAVKDLKAGVIDKVVLARTLELISDHRPDIGRVLHRLQAHQTGNFIFSMEVENDCFIGATPERLVRKQNNRLFSACLAGSIDRGRDPQEDDKLGWELMHDRKNRLEHNYVVSTVKNKLKMVCEHLNIPDQPILMKNKHIQHLYTPVEGTCAAGVSIFDIVAGLHPTPALGGLPRNVAIKWIRENEPFERGLYASPIGWSDSNGNGEFAVGIRSALVSGKKTTLFAGCGVVRESIPEKEYEETAIKFRPMLDGLEVADNGSR